MDDSWITPLHKKKQRTLQMNDSKQNELGQQDQIHRLQQRPSASKKSTKRTYYYDQCVQHKGNTKKLWKTINHVIHRTNNKTEVVEKLKINNLDEHRGDIIADELSSKHRKKILNQHATVKKEPE